MQVMPRCRLERRHLGEPKHTILCSHVGRLKGRAEARAECPKEEVMPKISLMEAFMVFLAIGPAANGNVCFWHKADIDALPNVRFRG